MAEYSTVDSATETFNEIIKITQKGASTLREIYSTKRDYFRLDFIDKLIYFGGLSQYKMSNVMHFYETIKDFPMFVNYMNETASEQLSLYNELFNVYFQAICRYKNKQFSIIKSKILYLLRAEFTLPAIAETPTVRRAKITIKSTYKPELPSLIDNHLDLNNIMQTQEALLSKGRREKIICTEESTKIELDGPVLRDTITSLISLQNTMLRVSNDLGIKSNPFLDMQLFASANGYK